MPSSSKQQAFPSTQQVSSRPLSNDTDPDSDPYGDPYDAYASIYGYMSPEQQGPQRQAFPQRMQSLPASSGDELRMFPSDQQKQKQQQQSAYAQPQQTAAVPPHHAKQQQLPNSYSQTSRPSFDVPDMTMQGTDAAENASIHSHSPLHTHRARFADIALDQPTTTPLQPPAVLAVKATDYGTSEKVNPNGTQPFPGQKEQRALPEGYHTPPSFSRASSGWGTSRRRKESGGLSNSSPGTPMFTGNPYGKLGGLASKSDPALQFAEGDYAKSRFARFWFGLLASNWVLRWFVFIAPILVLFWIPGICA